MLWSILHNEDDAEKTVHACFYRLADKFVKYSHLPYTELERLSCALVKNAAADIVRECEKKEQLSNGVAQSKENGW